MPKNIVLLMADQWRWDTFQPEHVCQTPHFDAFRNEAVEFTNAYTMCPLCCPARGSLFTGKWPHQTGLMDNIGGGSYYPQGQLHIRNKTFPERLRDDAGYAISYAGKWHMGDGAGHQRGFDLMDATDATVRPKSSIVELPGGLDPYYDTYREGKGPDEQAIDAGLGHIRQLAAGAKPFCSVISTWGPHFAHKAPDRFAKLYEDYAKELGDDFRPDNYCEPFLEEFKPRMQSKPLWHCQNTRPLRGEDWRKTVTSYWAFCSFLDEQFGRVIALLDELGIAEDTVVAFTCDHGEMLGAHGNFDKGPYLYTEIMHLPMFVRAPEADTPFNSDGFVNLRDLWPTLASMAGAAKALTDDERSRSFWATDNDATFYGYDAYHGREFKLRGIRTARWAYNWSPHDLDELYDLENDPGERVNLVASAEHDEIRRQLHARLWDWMTTEGDYLLHTEHLLPSGAYIDGRDWDDQHKPNWTEDQWAWFYAMTPEDVGR